MKNLNTVQNEIKILGNPTIEKLNRARVILTATIIMLVYFMSACDVIVDRSESLVSSLNTTYNGEIVTTLEGQDFTDEINLNINSGSTLTGTFFRKSDGATGTISGVGSDVSAIFSGTIEGDCPESFNGTLNLNGNNKLSIRMEGTNCDGPFLTLGTLFKKSCINLAGRYDVSEEYVIRFTIGGETEILKGSGEANIMFEQDQCNVSMRVPGLDVIRTGKIVSNKLVLSGKLIVPLGGEIIITKNEFEATVDVREEYNFTFLGTGIAEGTIDGQSFQITAATEGKLDRNFNVAVALLRGFIIGAFEPGSSLDLMRKQAIDVDPELVIAKGFDANWDQIVRVHMWMNKITRNGDYQVEQILVGHSLGGDAVRTAELQKMYSRIIIDPIDFGLILSQGKFYQRDVTRNPTSTMGRIHNILASTTEVLEGGGATAGLLGYHITGAIESVEYITNHVTIDKRVLEMELVKDEVQLCLNSSIANSNSNNSGSSLWNFKPQLKGNPNFYFSFGWKQK